MTRSSFLDPQIKNNPSRAENSPLYFLGNHVPTVQKNTGRSKETYVEMQKTKASDLKIEGRSLYFLYILGLSLVFGWILKSWGPYAFAIPCRAQRETGLFSLSSFEGFDEVLSFSLSNFKDSSVLKALLFRAATKALNPGCAHAARFCTARYWGRRLAKITSCKMRYRRNT